MGVYPSPEDVAKIDAQLSRLGKPHRFHSYPGAGHAVLNATRPSDRAEAAADAWAKCLDMLRQHFRGSGGRGASIRRLTLSPGASRRDAAGSPFRGLGLCGGGRGCGLRTRGAGNRRSLDRG
jgi:hypothetical protein